LSILYRGEISASTSGPGPGGDVSVTAGSLSILNGEISAASTSGIGNGGTIEVTARRLRLARLGKISSDTGSAGDNGGTGTGGNVSVDVTGEGPGALSIRRDGEITASTFDGGKGGQVTVHVDGGLTIAAVGTSPDTVTGIAVSAEPGSTKNAGNVTIRARELTVVGRGGAISATTFGPGSGGDISVAAQRLRLAQHGEIAASTSGAGPGGRITLAVKGELVIDGAGAGITADAEAGSTRSAGDAVVRAGSLTLVDGGAVTDSAAGASGHLPASTGNAGTIEVDVGVLAIEGAGSRIATTTAPGTVGKAGSVAIRAGQITVAAGGQVVSTTAGAGMGGQVDVTARGALLLDGADAQIAASAIGKYSTGPGGNVTVTAGSLTIDGGAAIASSTEGSGAGGMITIVAGSAIVLSGTGPQITAMSNGKGSAGSIIISAGALLMSNDAEISTAAVTSAANARNITLSIGNLLYLVNSEITTSVGNKTGNGGNITIASELAVLDQSKIIAQAQQGNGGNITINKDAGAFLASADSIVSASSQKGVSGVVEINGITPLNGALVALSSELRSAVALSENSCAARAGRPQSSLVEAGRGGLPQDPEAAFPALYIAGLDVAIGPRHVAPRAQDGDSRVSMLRAAMRCD
jgi:large exoprotein involved in heme utilization and adhesion